MHIKKMFIKKKRFPLKYFVFTNYNITINKNEEINLAHVEQTTKKLILK